MPDCGPSGQRFCTKGCAGLARRKRIDRQCRRCGIRFEVKASKARAGRGTYCSRACAFPQVRKPCETCGKEIAVTESKLARGWGRFCSIECRDIERWGGDRKITFACAECGAPRTVTRTLAVDGGGTYCSTECMYRGRRNQLEHTCRICGMTFERAVSVGPAKFCSRACLTKWRKTDPSERARVQKMRQAMLAQRVPTRCESALYELMGDIFGSEWQPQFQLGYWTVDAAVPALQLVVQADGDYWHGRLEQHRTHLSVKRNRANDRRCDTYCAKNGWTVLRLWETDLLNDRDYCAVAIRESAHL